MTSVPYDSDPNPGIIKLAAKNIKIIPEDTVETPEFGQALEILLNSSQVFFLGFGFHWANLKRLGIKTQKIKHLNVKGTSMGLSYARGENFFSLIPELIPIKESVLFPEDVYTFLHKRVSFV